MMKVAACLVGVVLFVLALILVTGCPPPPNPPRPVNDGGVVACPEYCAHLRELGCAQGQPTKRGATCETVCGNIASSGYVQNARSCSMQARTCPDVDACER